jgi:N-acetylglucosamine malate deacetylase 2
LPSRPIAELLNRTLVVVAHPDDECIGAGALLQRMQHAALVFCTDGGPRDRYFWEKYGSREEYVRVRGHEAAAIAEIAGVERLELLPIADQELYLNLASALENLERLVREFHPEALLTIAYEGGHPDHDCCAFLSSILGKRYVLPVWEMPLYHRTKGGARQQEFLDPGDGGISLQVSADELERKRQMLAAYVSQAGVLTGFDLSIEKFRPQPNYDFTNPPRAEVINYEVWEWPVKASEVCARFAEIRSRVQYPVNSAVDSA